MDAQSVTFALDVPKYYQDVQLLRRSPAPSVPDLSRHLDVTFGVVA